MWKILKIEFGFNFFYCLKHSSAYGLILFPIFEMKSFSMSKSPLNTWFSLTISAFFMSVFIYFYSVLFHCKFSDFIPKKYSDFKTDKFYGEIFLILIKTIHLQKYLNFVQKTAGTNCALWTYHGNHPPVPVYHKSLYYQCFWAWSLRAVRRFLFCCRCYRCSVDARHGNNFLPFCDWWKGW